MNTNNNPSFDQALDSNVDFEFFKTLFDPVRYNIVKFLGNNGKCSIKKIADNFTQDRSVISRHLDLMFRYHIVSKQKENRHVYYLLNDLYILEKFEQTTSNLKKMACYCLDEPINIQP